MREIARDEGVESQYVSTLARRAGLPPREGWRRRYPINESAFQEPDSIGWWLLGLLAADGCVSTRDNLISLSQSERDIDVLHAFHDYVGCPDRPLTELRLSPGTSTWRSPASRHFEARVYSRRICEALAVHGIVPRKTHTLRLSDAAAGEPAVWLGALDGDGSLGVAFNHGRPRIDFIGTRALIEQCSVFWGNRLKIATGRDPALIRHAHGLWRVSLYGANASRAASILLASSPISMRRKRQKLQQIAVVGWSTDRAKN